MSLRASGWLGLLVCFFLMPLRAGDDVLAHLNSVHPRLLVQGQTWGDLRDKRQHSPALDQLLKKLEAEGRALMAVPPVQRVKVGKRLLATSREAERRILLLAFDYWITGDDTFRARAEQEMLAVAAFEDWNPSHFLDVGEMTAGMAIGYDWLYSVLSPQSRQAIRTAIIEKGLKPGLDPTQPQNYWYRAKMNWNQVCIGGLTLGALAIADDEPDIARTILQQTRANNPNGMEPYAPNGNYPEGPSYWEYGTTYQVLLLAALQTALGTDWNLSRSPGFLETAVYPMQMTGPTGYAFDYSDADPRVGIEPALYWFARRNQQPDVVLFTQQKLLRYLADTKTKAVPDRFLPLAAIWASDLDAVPKIRQPLAWLGEGPNPVAVFRSSWADPQALYLGLKGGSPSNNHAHMDAGSFVFDVEGVRWGEDLGKQDYESLESKKIDLWNKKQDSQRWQVFRLNNFSHSTLTINGQLHRVDGHAPIIRFAADGPTPHAVVDLSTIFAGQAGKVIRGFKLLPDHAVLIQDELSGLQPGDTVRWAMVTGTKATANGNSATLEKDGKTLQVTLTSPADARLEVIPADPPKDDYDAPNPGQSILIANLKAPASGELRIESVLHPGAGTVPAPPAFTPAESWSAPLPAKTP